MRWVLTGRPGVGKTTVVKKVARGLKERGVSVGGFYSEEVRDGRRLGFRLVDLRTGDVGVLAWVGLPGPRVGRYGVNLRDLERFARVLRESADSCQVVVVDEYGPMELKSPEFVTAFEYAMKKARAMLITVHYSLKDQFSDYIVVTEENRDSLVQFLVESILAEL